MKQPEVCLTLESRCEPCMHLIQANTDVVGSRLRNGTFPPPILERYCASRMVTQVRLPGLRSAVMAICRHRPIIPPATLQRGKQCNHGGGALFPEPFAAVPLPDLTYLRTLIEHDRISPDLFVFVSPPDRRCLVDLHRRSFVCSDVSSQSRCAS